jgi:hypothetical protein
MQSGTTNSSKPSMKELRETSLTDVRDSFKQELSLMILRTSLSRTQLSSRIAKWMLKIWTKTSSKSMKRDSG